MPSEEVSVGESEDCDRVDGGKHGKSDAAAQKRTQVSIIIVSFNTREVTVNCLASLKEGVRTTEHEIILVDNASTDGSVEAIVSEFPDVKVIRNATNLGFAAANNQGLSIASGEYILLLNSDVVVHPCAIDHVYEFAMSKSRAGVVGCRTLNADGSLQRNCFLEPSALNLLIQLLGFHRFFPRSRLWGRERMTYWDLDYARIVENVAGCFMLVKRAAIEEVGLMDEMFFMYAEEMDWCKRFRLSGWEVWYSPVGTITHFGGVSACKAAEEIKDEGVRSLARYLRKHTSVAHRSACLAVLTLVLVSRSVARICNRTDRKERRQELNCLLRRLRLVFGK